MNGICDVDIRMTCVDRLARIEQMLKDRIEQSQQERQRIEDVLVRHELRIFSLEKWRNWMVGACGVFGAFMAGVGDWLKQHLHIRI